MRRWRDVAQLTIDGTGERHFDFLFRTMATAAELGLRIHQRIFVVKSTLAELDDLIVKLDELPGEAVRYLSTFVYLGRAIKLEEERITESIRDSLPARISGISQRA